MVVNAGSSSLKLSLLDPGDRLVASRAVVPGSNDDMRHQLTSFLGDAPEVGAVGHRIVHGGPTFTGPVLLDERTQDRLDRLADLAPLHNPPGLHAVHVVRTLRPSLPQVACFDTAFHRTLPAKARTYAVPAAWRDRWALQRYGFHGLSHAWASRRAAGLLEVPLGDARLVTAHIGAGVSLAAVAGGRSVDTTMGFTPLEGLVMATRSGSVDPGLVLWVQRHGGLSAGDVESALQHESGLLGLSGVSGDLREVLAAADGGDDCARLAYQVYAYRIQTSLAAMVAALGGMDAVVFTGGAGEGSHRLRADVCAGLGFLGVPTLGPDNRDVHGDAVVSAASGRPAVVVVHAREDIEIARGVRERVG